MSRRDRLRKLQDITLKRQRAKGLLEGMVTLHLGTFTGYDPILGDPGTESSSTELVIDPYPIIENISVKDLEASGGTLLAGDLQISNITRDAAFTSLINNPATIWRISGTTNFDGDYKVIGGEFIEVNPISIVVKVRKVQT